MAGERAENLKNFCGIILSIDPVEICPSIGCCCVNEAGNNTGNLFIFAG